MGWHGNAIHCSTHARAWQVSGRDAFYDRYDEFLQNLGRSSEIGRFDQFESTSLPIPMAA